MKHLLPLLPAPNPLWQLKTPRFYYFFCVRLPRNSLFVANICSTDCGRVRTAPLLSRPPARALKMPAWIPPGGGGCPGDACWALRASSCRNELWFGIVAVPAPPGGCVCDGEGARLCLRCWVLFSSRGTKHRAARSGGCRLDLGRAELEKAFTEGGGMVKLRVGH